MSSSSMLNAVSRFIARRGRVQKFLSDNGTNLVGARKEMAKVFFSRKVTDDCSTKGVEWEFNPPGASHFGGVWERLIGVGRRILSTLWKDQVFTDETLATCLCEAESIVNSRPLTAVSCDASDADPLTPSKLLLLKGVYQYLGVESETVKIGMQAWKQVQALANGFWKRWLREYLQLLMNRQKWKNVCSNAQVGDIVLVKDLSLVRGHWPLGRIIEATPSDDGLVRKVKVRVGSKEYARPIQKLVRLLECEEKTEK